MAVTKTDNSFFVDKIKLRINHLPDDPIVLDCFAGSGLIWRYVAGITKKNIQRLPIEKKNIDSFHLPGDNLKYLSTLDLSQFNVIDLNAYGIPYKQLKIIFQSNFKGIIFVTFIQSVFGGVDFDMLVEYGFPKSMIKQSPSLFFKLGFDAFKQFLAKNGVQKIWLRESDGKRYLAFDWAGM